MMHHASFSRSPQTQSFMVSAVRSHTLTADSIKDRFVRIYSLTFFYKFVVVSLIFFWFRPERNEKSLAFFSMKWQDNVRLGTHIVLPQEKIPSGFFASEPDGIFFYRSYADCFLSAVISNYLTIMSWCKRFDFLVLNAYISCVILFAILFSHLSHIIVSSTIERIYYQHIFFIASERAET